VQVSVEDALAGLSSGVKDGSVPIEATFGGNLVCRQEKVSGDGRTIASNTCGVFSMQGWDQ
jgi:hypothetical protein